MELVYIGMHFQMESYTYEDVLSLLEEQLLGKEKGWMLSEEASKSGIFWILQNYMWMEKLELASEVSALVRRQRNLRENPP